MVRVPPIATPSDDPRRPPFQGVEGQVTAGWGAAALLVSLVVPGFSPLLLSGRPIESNGRLLSATGLLNRNSMYWFGA